MKNNLLEIYKNIYSLDKLNSKLIDGKDPLVSFILFDSNNRYYTLKNNTLISYSSLLSKNILYYIKDLEIKYEIKIVNYFPLCFINNNCVLMACKIDNVNNDNFYECNSSKEYKKIIDILKDKAIFYADNYADEIYTVEKYHRRYEFYKKYIKRYLLTDKRRKKSEFIGLVKDMIGKDNNSIIDVSCGDNEDIFGVSSNAQLVVGNDINLYQIKKVNNIFNDYIFTNNNLLNLPFKEKIFDVSYCKNTLHHLDNKDEMNKTFKYLQKISNKIIIIDIENPKKVGGLPEFLNRNLYIRYLKDAGRNFLTYDEFKDVINTNFDKSYNIKYSVFENILGKYMIAEIENRK